MGPRSCFRVVLDRKYWVFGGADALHRLVVEIDVSDLDVVRQGVGVSCKSVIL